VRTVGNTLLSSVRPFEVIGRWGGEEFLGVFSSVCETALQTIANRLCTLVKFSRIEIPQGTPSLTVSIGGTLARRDDTTASLVRRADTMMYESKRQGRARATVEDCPEQFRSRIRTAEFRHSPVESAPPMPTNRPEAACCKAGWASVPTYSYSENTS